MSATCPSGHRSATDDYCDTCGVAIDAPPSPAATAASPSLECPNCGRLHEADELFCEVCGLDFATGKLPEAPATPAPARSAPPRAAAVDAPEEASGWTLTISADRAFFDTNQAETPTEQLTFPVDRPPIDIELPSSEVLVGRRSDRSGLFPEIDLTGVADDPGASRRHAVLRPASDGWELVDQGSTNGTRVDGGAPVAAGVAIPLADGSRIHVGAWTVLTLRRRSKEGTSP